MPRIRRDSGPRAPAILTVPVEKLRESGWRPGDEITFNWDGKNAKMVLTKLPKQLLVSKAPAEVATSPASAQDESSVLDNIMSAPAKIETQGVPGNLSDRLTRRCPACGAPNHSVRSKCHVCDADLAANRPGPIGR